MTTFTLTSEDWKAPAGVRRGTIVAAIVALIVGGTVAVFYAVHGLTLSHYDAKAHLVVARRIFDSIRPGWMQVGAVWLPLPHLLNALPVQVDALYRTGASGVAMSVASFATAAAALWWWVASATGDRLGAWVAFTVFVAQPDVLYLQATPMTEPMLLAWSMLGLALTWRWLAGRAAGATGPAGLALAAACLTRYEAWPITAAALGACALLVWHQRREPSWVLARVGRLALWPAAAVTAFLVLSRLTVGRWLVTDGFYRPDPAMLHHPATALTSVVTGVVAMNGPLTSTMALVAIVIACRRAWQGLAESPLLLMPALAAAATLPLFAFWSGHPFRIRYMVPLALPLAAALGFGVAASVRWRRVGAPLIVVLALLESPPLSARAPMVLEAQWDRERSAGRQRVTACLQAHYDGSPVLASMGALAHYMQETSRAGFGLRTFIHEGLGSLWTDSLVWPGRHAGWVLISEAAPQRDPIARRLVSDPAFLDGFERFCDGGGVALYRLNRSPSGLRWRASLLPTIPSRARGDGNAPSSPQTIAATYSAYASSTTLTSWFPRPSSPACASRTAATSGTAGPGGAPYRQ